MSKTIQVSIKHKYSTISGKVGTIPAFATPDLGAWLDTDLYDGQILFNKADKKAFVRLGNEVQSWELSVAVPQIVTTTLDIDSPLVVLPGASDMTLAQIRELYTMHIYGEEVLTNPQTTLEDQGTGTINLNTEVYNGTVGHLKQFGTI